MAGGRRRPVHCEPAKPGTGCKPTHPVTIRPLMSILAQRVSHIRPETNDPPHAGRLWGQ
jgi:hypothetical protein